MAERAAQCAPRCKNHAFHMVDHDQRSGHPNGLVSGTIAAGEENAMSHYGHAVMIELSLGRWKHQRPQDRRARCKTPKQRASYLGYFGWIDLAFSAESRC
jgi:hypothetical protein